MLFRTCYKRTGAPQCVFAYEWLKNWPPRRLFHTHCKHKVAPLCESSCGRVCNRIVWNLYRRPDRGKVFRPCGHGGAFRGCIVGWNLGKRGNDWLENNIYFWSYTCNGLKVWPSRNVMFIEVKLLMRLSSRKATKRELPKNIIDSLKLFWMIWKCSNVKIC